MAARPRPQRQRTRRRGRTALCVLQLLLLLLSGCLTRYVVSLSCGPVRGSVRNAASLQRNADGRRTDGRSRLFRSAPSPTRARHRRCRGRRQPTGVPRMAERSNDADAAGACLSSAASDPDSKRKTSAPSPPSSSSAPSAPENAVAKHNDANNNADNENGTDGTPSTESKSTAELLREVDEWRKRAQQLRSEAQQMESQLNSQQASQKMTNAQDVDATIERILPVNTTVINVAGKLRMERWTSRQVLTVVDRLFERQVVALGPAAGIAQSSPSSASSSSSSSLSSPQNAQQADNPGGPVVHNITEFHLLTDCLQKLLDASVILDNETEQQNTNRNQRWEGRVEMAIQSRLRELKRAHEANVKRVMAHQLNSLAQQQKQRRQQQQPVTASSSGRTVHDNNSSNNNNNQTQISSQQQPSAGSIEEYMIRSLTGDKSFFDASSGANNGADPNADDMAPFDRMKQWNLTAAIERIAWIPLWVPSSFLPFYLVSKHSNLGPEEVTRIKDNVLMGSRFYVTSSQSIPGAAIFRGNVATVVSPVDTSSSTTTTSTTSVADIWKSYVPYASSSSSTQNGRTKSNKTAKPKRSSSPERNNTAMVFEDVQRRLKKEKLDDKVQLFMIPDPEWDTIGTGQPAKPVIIAFSKDMAPDHAKLKVTRLQNAVKKLSYPLSAMTTFAYAVSCYALNPTFFQSLVNQNDVSVLVSCIPVFLGLIGIQLVQETAHFLMAKKRNIRLGKPVPIPSPQLGLFGCITPLRSFPKNRAALMDLALVGPAASAVASLACIVLGIFGSVHASMNDISRFPVIPSVLLKSSFFIGSLLSWLAPKAMMVPAAQPVPIHPLFVVGFSGLLSSALNFLPIFRLDGGRASSAAMGDRQGGVISAAALLVMLSAVLSEGSGLAATWLVAVLLFQRQPEISARDEATELDRTRMTLWFGSLLFAVLVLLPFPGAPIFL